MDYPIYYKEFYKEIVQYELNLLKDNYNTESTAKQISDKILNSKNYLLQNKINRDEVYQYTLDQVKNYNKSKVEVTNLHPNIYQWYKRDLLNSGRSNYRIIPNYSEEDLYYTYNVLKTNNRYVQCGFIINRDKESVLFCLTKPKGQRNTPKDWRFEDGHKSSNT